MARKPHGQDEYTWISASLLPNHSYLAPTMLRTVGDGEGRSILDLGCGNGALTSLYAKQGFTAVGAERSGSGLEIARTTFPDVRFVAQDLEQPLSEDLRQKFDIVVATEVIEHMLLPRQLFARAHEALKPGGMILFSTPFHGYWKNLALAVTNRFDQHWDVSWDYGHVKFFSMATLSAMAVECGFEPQGFERLGRVPALAKTMVFRAVQRG